MSTCHLARALRPPDICSAPRDSFKLCSQIVCVPKLLMIASFVHLAAGCAMLFQ